MLYPVNPPGMNFVFSFVAVLSTFNSVSVAGSRPEIVEDILPEIKQQGQTGYLNCSVINLTPTAYVQWIKRMTPSGDPMIISSNETIKIERVIDGKRKYEIVRIRRNNTDIFQLIIHGLTEIDSGEYSCRIVLFYQSWQTWPVKNVNLTVKIPPTIYTGSAATLIVDEGENVTLTCEVYGVPAPNVTWKRGDGLPLPNGGFLHIGGTYHLYNLDARDRGEFICIADNNVKPPADYTVQLEVRYKPHTRALQDTVGQGQSFNAKLDCIVEANPFANVTWLKTNLTTNERVQIQDNDKYDLNQKEDERLKDDEKWYTLLIKSVQGNDYGDYYCTATNQFGTVEAKFRLFETIGCQGHNCPSVEWNGSETTTMIGNESETAMMTGNDSTTTIMMRDDIETTTMTGNESKTTIMTGNESTTKIMMRDDIETTTMTGNDSKTAIMTWNEFETTTTARHGDQNTTMSGIGAKALKVAGNGAKPINRLSSFGNFLVISVSIFLLKHNFEN